MYIRTVNSYLTWLHDEGHAPERLRVKLLRSTLRQHVLLSDADLRRIVTYRPGTVERQTWVLLMTLLDTGLQITEALTLERARVNLDTLVLTVMGKGAKERTVPFSLALRRVLFRHLQQTPPHSPYVFASRSGCRLLVRNAYRSLVMLGRLAAPVAGDSPAPVPSPVRRVLHPAGRGHLPTVATARPHVRSRRRRSISGRLVWKNGRERLTPLSI
jgi:integrase